jgi:hypothetical protein
MGECSEPTTVWITRDEIMALPMSGTTWSAMVSVANSDFGRAVGGLTDNHDVNTLAQAYVAVRTDNQGMKRKVVDHLLSAIGSEGNENSLSASRNLTSYVVAADVLGFQQFDGTNEAKFRDWVRKMITMQHGQGGQNGGGCSPPYCTIPEKMRRHPENHGTVASAAYAAASIYLKESANLGEIDNVFQGYLGDRSKYIFDDKFFGGPNNDNSWQANPSALVGVNQKGTSKGGHSIDGAEPEEMRRGGVFKWPPVYTNYPWAGLQGSSVTAEILFKAGYPSWDYMDKAVLRAIEFLYSADLNVQDYWGADGDDYFVIKIINKRYGKSFTATNQKETGKCMGWTGWTHQ